MRHYDDILLHPCSRVTDHLSLVRPFHPIHCRITHDLKLWPISIKVVVKYYLLFISLPITFIPAFENQTQIWQLWYKCTQHWFYTHMHMHILSTCSTVIIMPFLNTKWNIQPKEYRSKIVFKVCVHFSLGIWHRRLMLPVTISHHINVKLEWASHRDNYLLEFMP